MLIDTYLAYQFIKKLVTPFEDMNAYKLGLIDKDGNFLRQRKYFSPEDKRALGYFDVLVINLKRLLGKLPGGKSKIATIAAAMLLLRSDPKKRVVESVDGEIDCSWLEEEHSKIMRALEEEVPVNTTAGVAGLTPETLGVSKKAQKKHKTILKRNVPDVDSSRAL